MVMRPQKSRFAQGLWLLWRLKLAVGAGVILLAIVVGAIFAPYLAPHNPLATDITLRLKPPSWMAGGNPDYLLGTDQVGRDILSRIIFGGRVSLLVGSLAVLLSAIIGIPLGLAAGYGEHVTDAVISTLVNIMLTFPFVLLALAVIAVLGPSFTNMIIVLGITNWPLYTRVVRAEVLRLKGMEFVMAARALGMGQMRLIAKQLFPNLLSAVVVISSVLVARMIILESFLSFLGLGIQPPTPSWGGMLGEGKDYMLLRWWLATFPGLAIFITTLLINLVGDGLRDWLDPALKV
jgi:ABC-type dipeptide/oligopeptide/nickel transport system permease subunit